VARPLAGIVFAAVVAAGASVPVIAQADHSHQAAGKNDQAAALVKVVRDATERFRDVSVAEAEGYALQFGCVSGPDYGAMGMHFVNFPLVTDGELDATRPEIVIYEPYRRFRFCVQDHALWDFTLEPVAGGTLVTHRHRLESSASLRLLAPIIRLRTRQNANNMARTIQNLARLVGAPAPTDLQISHEPPILD